MAGTCKPGEGSEGRGSAERFEGLRAELKAGKGAVQGAASAMRRRPGLRSWGSCFQNGYGDRRFRRADSLRNDGVNFSGDFFDAVVSVDDHDAVGFARGDFSVLVVDAPVELVGFALEAILVGALALDVALVAAAGPLQGGLERGQQERVVEVREAVRVPGEDSRVSPAERVEGVPLQRPDRPRVARRRSWVVFPEPSRPSKVMKYPRGIGTSLPRAGIHDSEMKSR